jgi:predicted nuclease of predicted toxin-antitoxin system
MAGRLLFDENLSPRLVSVTADAFPGSIHIRDAGLMGETDQEIWAFAQQRGYTIVTKDDDYRGLSLLRGPRHGDGPGFVELAVAEGCA